MSQPVSDKTPDTLFLDNLQKISIVSSGWHKPIVENAVNAAKEYFEKNGIAKTKKAHKNMGFLTNYQSVPENTCRGIIPTQWSPAAYWTHRKSRGKYRRFH